MITGVVFIVVIAVIVAVDEELASLSTTTRETRHIPRASISSSACEESGSNSTRALGSESGSMTEDVGVEYGEVAADEPVDEAGLELEDGG